MWKRKKKQKNFSVLKLDIQKKFVNLNIKIIIIPNKTFYSNKIKLIFSNFNTYYIKGLLSTNFIVLKIIIFIFIKKVVLRYINLKI